MKWAKITLVIFGAIAITALGIDASDTLRGSSDTMLANLIGGNGSVCPDGMVEVPAALSFTCVDRYEAAAAESCAMRDPANEFASQDNLNEQSCSAVSTKERMPWRFITRDQAQLACARAGKRLPTSAEWYQAALGSVDTAPTCNVDSGGVRDTGISDDCVSAAGAFDVVGNVWEWVSDDVIDGTYEGRSLPQEGYVAQIDSGGMPTVSASEPDQLFNEDYFWTRSDGAYGVMRGGFYGSGDDAGVYAVHTKTSPRTAGGAIGFRCVR